MATTEYFSPTYQRSVMSATAPTKQFFVGRYKMDVVIEFIPDPRSADPKKQCLINYQIKNFDADSLPDATGRSGVMTSAERQNLFDQILGWACTLPHGFAGGIARDPVENNQSQIGA